MNRIELNFVECSPAPPGGYVILWRVQGSADPFTNAGVFYTSPAVFFDSNNIAGTKYEGYIQSQFPGLTCDQIPWESDPGSGSSSGACNGSIFWNFQQNAPQTVQFRIYVNGVIKVLVTTTQTGEFEYLPGQQIDIVILTIATGTPQIDVVGTYNITTDGAVTFTTVNCGVYYVYGIFNP